MSFKRILEICGIPATVKISFIIVDKFGQSYGGACGVCRRESDGSFTIAVKRDLKRSYRAHVIAHELRHVYQYLNGMFTTSASEFVRQDDGSVVQISWYQRPREIDAEEFAYSVSKMACFDEFGVMLNEKCNFSYGGCDE